MKLKERVKKILDSKRVKIVDLFGEKIGVKLLSVLEYSQIPFKEDAKGMEHLPEKAEFLARQFVDPDNGEAVFDPQDITFENLKELIDAFTSANMAGGKDAEKNSGTTPAE